MSNSSKSSPYAEGGAHDKQSNELEKDSIDQILLDLLAANGRDGVLGVSNDAVYNATKRLQDRERQARIEAELSVWKSVKSCVENNGDNTQRLMRFNLPDYSKLISDLEEQLKGDKS